MSTTQRETIAREELRRWTMWLERDGAVLSTLPLPKSVLLDRQHWDDFVYEGGDKFLLEDFEVTSLQVPEAKSLLSLLEFYVPNEDKLHSWLYRALRERCGLPALPR